MNNIRKYLSSHISIFLWLLVIIYIIVFSFLLLKKLDNFLYNANDLAIFNQVFWNSLHGHWFDLTVNVNSYLADHFSPIIILLLPLYALHPGPQILLIIQIVVSALCVWPLIKITKLIIPERIYLLVISLLWLLNPLIHSGVFYEFHLLHLSAFFILWAFYFYQKDNFYLFVLFIVLSLLVREDIAIILLGFYPLTWLDKKSSRWKVISLLLPLGYFILALKVISFFSPTDSYKFFIYYQWLGGSDLLSILWSWLTHPWQVIKHTLTFNNFSNIIIVLLTVLCLPLFRSKYLWLVFFPLAQIIFTSSGLVSFAVFSHYIFLFAPGVFIASIFALEKIAKKQYWLVNQNKVFTSLVFILSLLYFCFFLSPAFAGLNGEYPQSQTEITKNLADNFTDNDRLVVSTNLAPKLSNRSELYLIFYAYSGHTQFAALPWQLPPADYLLVDWQDFMSDLSRVEYSLQFEQFRDIIPGQWQQTIGKFNLKEVNDGYYLFVSKDKDQGNSLLLGPVFKELESQAKVEEKLTFINPYWQLELKYSSEEFSEGYYLVRFYRQDDSYYDVPIDYGLLPIRLWPDKQAVSFYYYLNQEVVAYQVLEWTEPQAILGRVNEVNFQYITNLVIDKRLLPFNK